MIHAIHSADDYEQAREEIAKLAESDTQAGSANADRLATLRGLVAAYLEARADGDGHPDSSAELDVHADLTKPADDEGKTT